MLDAARPLLDEYTIWTRGPSRRHLYRFAYASPSNLRARLVRRPHRPGNANLQVDSTCAIAQFRCVSRSPVVDHGNCVVTVYALQIAYINAMSNLEFLAGNGQIPDHIFYEYWTVECLHREVTLVGALY